MSIIGGGVLGDILVRITTSNAGLKAGLKSSEALSKKYTKNVNSQLNSITKGWGKAGAATSKFGKEFSAGLKDSQQNVDLLAKKAGSLAGLLVNPFTVGAIAVAGFGLALKSSIQTAAEFEKAFANVTTLFDTTKFSTREMQVELLSLDATLGSVIGLTNAAYQAISSGVAPTQAVEAVGEAAIFAKAALVDQFTAIDLGTTVINAYGQEVSDLNQVYSVLFKTIEQGKTVGPELAENLGIVIPFAATLGVSLEELNAALAAMTKGGVRTSRATTALRQVFATFLNPAAEATELALELGASLDYTTIETMGLLPALRQLAVAAQGDSQAIATLFGNVRALTAVLALTGKQAEEFERILGILENTTRAHNLAMEKQLDTLTGQWERTGDLIERFEILLGLAPGGALKNALTAINNQLQIVLNTLLEIKKLDKESTEEKVENIATLIDATYRFLNVLRLGSPSAVGAFGIDREESNKALTALMKSGSQLTQLREAQANNLENLNRLMYENTNFTSLEAFQQAMLAGRTKEATSAIELQATALDAFGVIKKNLGEDDIKQMTKIILKTEELKIQLLGLGEVATEIAILDLEFNRLFASFHGASKEQMRIAKYFDAQEAIILKKAAEDKKQEREKLLVELTRLNEGELAGEIAELKRVTNEKIELYKKDGEMKALIWKEFKGKLKELRGKDTEEQEKELEKLEKSLRKIGLSSLAQAKATFELEKKELEEGVEHNLMSEQEKNDRLLYMKKELARKVGDLGLTETQMLQNQFTRDLAFLEEALALEFGKEEENAERILQLRKQLAMDEQEITKNALDAHIASLEDKLDATLDLAMKESELNILYRAGDFESFKEALDQKTASNISFYESQQDLMDLYSEMAVKSQFNQFQLLANVSRDAFSSISSNLTAIATGAKSAEEAIKDIGMALVESVVAYLAEWVIANAMALVLEGAHTTASTAMAAEIALAWAPAAALVSAATFGASAVAGAAALVGTFAVAEGIALAGQATSEGASLGTAGPELGGGIAVQPEFYAEGGLVTRPTLAIIGEAGPEYVLPVNQVPKSTSSEAGEREISIYVENINGVDDIDALFELLNDRLSENLKASAIRR